MDEHLKLLGSREAFREAAASPSAKKSVWMSPGFGAPLLAALKLVEDVFC